MQYGNSSNKLSSCLNEKNLKFSVFKFPRSHFFRREIKIDKNNQDLELSSLLNFICDTAVSLLSKQALYLLSRIHPVTEKLIEKVLFHLNNIEEKVEATVPIDILVKNQDFSEIIHQELMKNKILYTKCVNNYYFLVGTDGEKNFHIASDYEKESCSVEEKQKFNYFIDF